MDSGAWHRFTTLRSTYNCSERNAFFSELMFAEDLVEYCVCASDTPPFKPLVKILPQTNVCIFVRTIGEAWSPFQSHTNNPKINHFTSSTVYLHSDPSTRLQSPRWFGALRLGLQNGRMERSTASRTLPENREMT